MLANVSLAQSLASLPESQRKKLITGLTEKEAAELLHDWRFWARPKQLPPPGDWLTWIIRAGRGFGKTRTGAGWTHERAMEYPGRWIAYVAQTPADARDYMIEGRGGILQNTPERDRPLYEPSKRRLTWPNGSWATVYSDEKPDQLRGFSGDTAWLDEFAKFKNPKDVWDNLAFGMREASSDRPRRLITTTPRPIDILIRIEKDPTTTVVTGSSYENRVNLDPIWYEKTIAPYEGTRFGRQEIHAEIIEDVEGALWTRAMFDVDGFRVSGPPGLARVVVAIDPAATSGEDADETGIVVAGVGNDGLGYVLADESCRASPDGWARRAIGCFDKFKADRIVAEVNNGGEMVEHTLRTIDRNIPYKAVHASRGKRVRAEPVAALYEQGKVRHVGALPKLEDQMCSYVPDIPGSPDRLDAMVWAMTELMIQAPRENRPRITLA